MSFHFLVHYLSSIRIVLQITENILRMIGFMKYKNLVFAHFFFFFLPLPLQWSWGHNIPSSPPASSPIFSTGEEEGSNLVSHPYFSQWVEAIVLSRSKLNSVFTLRLLYFLCCHYIFYVVFICAMPQVILSPCAWSFHFILILHIDFRLLIILSELKYII